MDQGGVLEIPVATDDVDATDGGGVITQQSVI
jgi:hypothetical protein